MCVYASYGEIWSNALSFIGKHLNRNLKTHVHTFLVALHSLKRHKKHWPHSSLQRNIWDPINYYSPSEPKTLWNIRFKQWLALSVICCIWTALYAYTTHHLGNMWPFQWPTFRAGHYSDMALLLHSGSTRSLITTRWQGWCHVVRISLSLR